MLWILGCHQAVLSPTCVQPRCYSTMEAGLMTATPTATLSPLHPQPLCPSPPHTHPQVMEARRYGLRRRASATEREPFSGVMAGMTCMLRQTAAGCPPVEICYCSRTASDSVCACESGLAQTYRAGLHYVREAARGNVRRITRHDKSKGEPRLRGGLWWTAPEIEQKYTHSAVENIPRRSTSATREMSGGGGATTDNQWLLRVVFCSSAVTHGWIMRTG